MNEMLLWREMEQVDWKYWNGTSSRIPRLGLADECSVMMERVLKCG